MSAAAQIKALATLIREAWNHGNYRVVYATYSESYRGQDSGIACAPGPAGVIELAKILRSALDGFHLKVDAVVAQGDQVATRFTIRGRHVASLFEIPASKRAVELRGVWFHRFAGGKIVEGWTQWDVWGLLCQLGRERPLGSPLPPLDLQ